MTGSSGWDCAIPNDLLGSSGKYDRGRRRGQPAVALRPLEPLWLVDRFPPLHRELLTLLRGLGPDDWDRSTVCALWSVRDITAHLLDDDLRRLSFHRDAHPPPP